MTVLINPFRFASASGGSWSPLDLTSLAAWYDASDASTFTYSSGSVVSQWNDKSGLGRHLTQATTSKHPSRTGTQNGLSTVTFAADDRLAVAPSPAIFTTDVTVVQVWKAAASGLPTYFRPPAGTDQDNAMGAPFDRWQSTTDNQFYMDNSAVAMSLNIRGRTSHFIHLMSADKDAVSVGTHRIRERASGADTTAAASLADAWSITSQRLTVGARGDNVVGFVGDVAEIVYVNALLSAPDLASLESYLTSKWGL